MTATIITYVFSIRDISLPDILIFSEYYEYKSCDFFKDSAIYYAAKAAWLVREYSSARIDWVAFSLSLDCSIFNIL